VHQISIAGSIPNNAVSPLVSAQTQVPGGSFAGEDIGPTGSSGAPILKNFRSNVPRQYFKVALEKKRYILMVQSSMDVFFSIGEPDNITEALDDKN
jgi:hypothetical protein